MKYPAGFSLLEIMLVIVIVGVVVVASQSLFVGTQQSKYAGLTCANYVFGEMRAYYFDALVGKQIANNTTPELYLIDIDTEEGTIDFGYGSGNMLNTGFNTLTITDAPNARQCANSGYEIILSGSSLTLEIPRHFNKRDGSGIMLYTGNNTANRIFTGELVITQQPTDQSKPSNELAKIAIDVRTQSLTLKNCSIFNRQTGVCTTRQQ